MQYSVILHNYKESELTCMIKNYTLTMKNFNSLSNALFYVEEFISDYIEKFQGDVDFKYVFEKPEMNNNFKEGFFVIKFKSHSNRFKIYRRFRYIGWLTNSQVDIPQFEIFISIVNPTGTKQELIQHNINFDKKTEFKECLKCIDKEYKSKIDKIDTVHKKIDVKEQNIIDEYIEALINPRMTF